MAARALWKAVVKLGKLSVPVRMYSAVQDRDTHFHLVHVADKVRVHERLRRADDGELVEREQTHSGYTLETGEMVLLDRDELRSLAPKPSRDISVLHSVPMGRLPLSAYLRPYWLGPDGDEDAYFALAQALEAAGRAAISEWVMRGKHHYGALCARDGFLMLIELSSADQWLDVRGLKPSEGTKLEAREKQMAEQLIAGLAGAFEHERFHDAYREQVAALVEAKARGRKLPGARAPARRPKERSLQDALDASLRALKKSGSHDKERKSA